MKRNTNETELRGVTATEQVEFKVTRFLGRNKVALMVIGLAIVLVLVVMLIFNAVYSKNLEKAFDKIDQATTRYSELVAMDPQSDDYKNGMQELKDMLGSLAKGKSYPSLKAQYMLATIAFEEKDYQSAEAGYMAIYNAKKDTYLGPLSLFNAAVVAEDSGNEDQALEYYTRVWDEFGTDAPEAPKALFNQARLQGKQGQNELAKATYQQLIDQFPSSEYARLAQTAILAY